MTIRHWVMTRIFGIGFLVVMVLLGPSALSVQAQNQQLMGNWLLNMAHPLNQGIVGWWRGTPSFTGGTTVADLMPAASHGTWNSMGSFGGTGGWNPTSRRGGYMMFDFNGSAGYIDVGARGALDNMPQKTIIAWFNMRSWGGAFLGRMVDKKGGGGEGAGNGWFFSIDGNGNGRISFFQDFSTTKGWWAYDDGATVGQLGIWRFVAVSYDRTSTSNVPQFYVDGQPVTLNVTNSTPVGTAVDDSGVSLKIGDDGTGTRVFDGNLEDIIVYNMILSPAIIAQMYQLSLQGYPGVFAPVIPIPAQFVPDIGIRRLRIQIE